MKRRPMTIHVARTGFAIALAATLSAPIAAQATSGAPATPPHLRSLVWRVEGQERARVRRDQLFKSVDTVRLQADIYLPPEGRAGVRVPVLLFSGGGSFGANGTRGWTLYRQYGELAAAHGMAGVVFDKRSRQGAQGLADATADIDDLVAYLQRNADTLGIDAQRICLWGFSAGGRYVYAGMRDSGPKFTCLVAYYGMGLYELVRQATALGDRLPPTLIARSGLDDFNMPIDLFVHEAINRNVRLELHNYPDGHHAFDVVDDTERSRQIMRRTFEFLREQLGVR